MDTATVALVFTATSILINLGVVLWGASRAQSKSEARHDLSLAAAVKEINESITKHKDVILDQRERDLRAIGETITSIRASIQTMELYAERTFARRESLETMTGRLETQMVKVEEKMVAQMEKLETATDINMSRMETKIDAQFKELNDRLNAPRLL